LRPCQVGLAGQYIVKIPPTANDVTARAAAHDWLPDPAHTVLAGPSFRSQRYQQIVVLVLLGCLLGNLAGPKGQSPCPSVA
jgi:hypothetical protein